VDIRGKYTIFPDGISQSAIAAYRQALKAPGAQKIHGTLYSNISATCLHLSKPGHAYLSAKAALATNFAEPQLVAKAVFRQGSAAYQLRCFNEALALFKRGLATSGSDSKARGMANEFDECLVRTSQRLREQTTGAYDFQTMFSDVIAGGLNPRIDIADFVGPVEIRASPNKGRGLYVTRDVVAGELLLVSKAVSVAGWKDPELENLTVLAVNLANDSERDQTEILNTTRLVHLCIDNPSLYFTVCHLYAGNAPSSSQPPLGTVDTEKKVLEQLVVELDVDVGRLDQVLAFNSFGDFPVEPCFGSTDPAEAKRTTKFLEEHTNTSLFYLPSFCNHACMPNAHRAHYGDVMVVRTLLPLSKGDEITLGYVSPEVSVEDREKRLGFFGFQCDCWYCREQKMDGEAARKRREEELTIKLPKAMALACQATDNAAEGDYDAELFSAAFKAIEVIRVKVEATYHPDRGLFRPEMCHIWRVLSDLHFWKDIRKSIEVLLFLFLSVSASSVLIAVPLG
jgi:hypothetical protein